MIITSRPTRRIAAAALSGSFAALALVAVSPSAFAAAPDGITATCTSIVGGPIAGPITVGANEKLCIREATVTGAITVVPGGSLAIRRSTVVGAISLSGAQNFKFCGSTTMGGAIEALDGVGLVFIGEANKCRGNNIDGAVTVTGTVQNVRVEQNSIGGALTVNDNAPVNNKAPLIIGNTIVGALACSNNKPAPENGGEPNTVFGMRSGQCASPTF